MLGAGLATIPATIPATILAAILATTLVAGCSSGGGSGSGSGVQIAALELTKLTVAAVPVGDDVGLYIAQDKGYFNAAGLDVTIDPIVSSAVATAGQNSGKYDITAGNSVSYIQAQLNGQANLEIVAEGSLMQPGNQALYTPPKSTITTVPDLKGKRIGVNVLNNIGTLLITSLLKAYDMAPDSVTFVPVNQGFPAMAKALQDHTIDVAWLPEPFGSLDQETLGLHKLADLDQGETQNFPVSWYVATKAWAKRYPRTLAAFLGALQRGQQVANNDRSAVENAMENLPLPYRVSPMIASTMSVENYPLNVAPHIDLTTVQQVADVMYDLNMLTGPFDVNTMLTP
jgi:NitT/TauT family transport system substrate-binding protein